MSDIIHNYIKLSKEKEEKSRLSQKDIKELEKLYDIKCDAPKDMQYENNIMELAHPKPCVINQAYDAINGLVENENERHTILVKLFNKPVDGKLNDYKLATTDLARDLTKVGSFCKNTNNKELQALADSCLIQINDSFNKTAGLPLIIGGVAAGIGLFYWWQHSAQAVDTITTNGQVVVSELEGVMSSGDESDWFGSKYSNALVKLANKTISDVKKVVAASEDLKKICNEILTETSAETLAKDVSNNNALQNKIMIAKKSIEDFTVKIKPSMINLVKLQNFLSQKQFRVQNTETSSTWSNITKWLDDRAGGALSGGWGLFSDKLTTLSRDIGSFLSACTESVKYYNVILANSDKHNTDAQVAVDKMIADSMKADSIKEPTAPTSPTPTATPTSPAGANSSMPQLDLEPASASDHMNAVASKLLRKYRTAILS